MSRGVIGKKYSAEEKVGIAPEGLRGESLSGGSFGGKVPGPPAASAGAGSSWKPGNKQLVGDAWRQADGWEEVAMRAELGQFKQIVAGPYLKNRAEPPLIK